MLSCPRCRKLDAIEPVEGHAICRECFGFIDVTAHEVHDAAPPPEGITIGKTWDAVDLTDEHQWSKARIKTFRVFFQTYQGFTEDQRALVYQLLQLVEHQRTILYTCAHWFQDELQDGMKHKGVDEMFSMLIKYIRKGEV